MSIAKKSANQQKNGIFEKEQCDKIAENFKRACDVFDISYDRHIRTTDEDQITFVKNVYKSCSMIEKSIKKATLCCISKLLRVLF